MKVRIRGHEWYPVLIVEEGKKFHDVDEDTLRRWESAFETFRACQREMLKFVGTWEEDDLP